MKNETNSIVFFTKYTYAGASSRYRVYQFVPYFELSGFRVVVIPLFTDDYLTAKYNKEPTSLLLFIKLYLKRIIDVLKVSNKSRVYIEYELLPYFPLWLERWFKWKGINYVVGYDDAVFHKYDSHHSLLIRWLFGRKIPGVIKKAQKVITGSQYLTQFALKYNSHLVEIPTSIDFVKYVEKPGYLKSNIFTIGWIGTPSSSQNVINILSALKKFLTRYSAKLVLIGFDRVLAEYVNSEQIELVSWSEPDEIPLIKSFDVGIMPLDRTPFNQGKCGFKLIQYMACGLPTISTPLVANVNIDKGNGNLFASTNDEWFDALEKVYTNYEYFISEVGTRNMDVVKKHYSIQANYPLMIEVFTKSD